MVKPGKAPAPARFKKCEACSRIYSDILGTTTKGFLRRVRKDKWQKQRWCSTSCRWVSQAATYIEKACDYCGRIFNNKITYGRRPGQIVNSARFKSRRVCSISCKSFLQAQLSVKQKFLKNVGKQRKDSCLYWRGNLQHFGHGRIELAEAHGLSILAHRLSYALFIGPVPALRLVCHTCNVPQCVNPRHLYLGDHVTNGADRAKKARPIAQNVKNKNFIGIAVDSQGKIFLTNCDGNPYHPKLKGRRLHKELRRQESTRLISKRLNG